MNRILSNRVVSVTAPLAAGLVATAVLAAPAGATTPTPAPSGKALSRIQAAGAKAIARREKVLTRATNRVAADRTMSAADRSALDAIFAQDSSGLAALGRTLAADTTVPAARKDYRMIFSAYRVFALVVPQTRLAADADALTARAVPRLDKAQTALQNALTAHPDKNTPAVQSSMSDLASRIGDIGTQTDGLSATVLGYTPAQYDANHRLLAPSRAKLRTARTDLRHARRDVRSVRRALK